MKDMTTGSPFKIMVAFSLPMLVSMMFQQLYNIADSVIAGRYAGVDALAAVGASYPITMIFLAFATGSSIGCTVIISQLFGAKKMIHMKSAIFTALISMFGLSIFMLIAGTLTTNLFMTALKTPQNIFADSALYLNVYVWGLPFLFMYNAANAVFLALGDSKTPLAFLIFSSVFNVILDMYFVRNLHMGVGGVAWATFIAQGIASVLAVAFLLWRISKMNIKGKFAWFEINLLKRIAIVAVPSVIQQSFVSVGQLFIQGLLNTYGSDAVAGYSAAFKINTFSITCITTMSNALSSFVAQNFGARKFERIVRGYKVGFSINVVFGLLVAVACLLFSTQFINLFLESGGDNQKVLEYGRTFLMIVTPFHAIVAVKIITDAVLKGAGYMQGFMISTFVDLILRVIFSYIFAAFGGFTGLCWAYPLGWVIGTVFSIVFYAMGKWKQVRLI